MNLTLELTITTSIGIRRVQFVHDGTEALCHFQTCDRVSESLNCLENLEHCPVDDMSPC
jgi:hypothetical protein